MPAEGTPWMERFELEPVRAGRLDGLSFAVKDFFDVAGKVTGCGNPDWLRSQAPALQHAAALRSLLEQGARCAGKTITDEFAYSLVGENHFYGTPLNPAAPDRVPGGSSSGSASAVAQGLVDFALGTDTAGSVRVPASNCGIYGFRPSHGRISLAGVQALAPSYDTAGVLARTAAVLDKAAGCLLENVPEATLAIEEIWMLEDAWEMADEEVRQRRPEMSRVWEEAGLRMRSLYLRDFVPDPFFWDLMRWKEAFSETQPVENWRTFGGWIESVQPAMGPRIAENFRFAKMVVENFSPEKLERRKEGARLLRGLMRPGMALGIPTVPAIPPLKGQVEYDRSKGSYLPRVLAFSTLAGIAGLPQVTLPLAGKGRVPAGFSLVGGRDEDRAILELARKAGDGVDGVME